MVKFTRPSQQNKPVNVHSDYTARKAMERSIKIMRMKLPQYCLKSAKIVHDAIVTFRKHKQWSFDGDISKDAENLAPPHSAKLVQRASSLQKVFTGIPS